MVDYGKTVALDKFGDFYRLGNNPAEAIGGVEKAKQNLKVTLQTVEGEQPFAPDYGLDIFEIIDATDPIIKREIRTTLEDRPIVDSVPNINITDKDPRNRTLSATIDVVLAEGEEIQITI